MTSVLTTVLDDPRVWRASGIASGAEGIPTRQARLDALLPDGWPIRALTEILAPRRGGGELGLVLPALVAMERCVAFIGSPYPPYAPALVTASLDISRLICVEAAGSRVIWAADEILQSDTCGAVLVWLDRIPMRQLRRLQLAAGQDTAAVFLFRPAGAASKPSPAALRLRVDPAPEGLYVRVLKRRGGRPSGALIPGVS